MNTPSALASLKNALKTARNLGRIRSLEGVGISRWGEPVLERNIAGTRLSVSALVCPIFDRPNSISASYATFDHVPSRFQMKLKWILEAVSCMEAAWQKPIDLSLIIADRGLTLDPVFDDDEIFFPIIERTATLYTQKASELLGRTCSVSTFSALWVPLDRRLGMNETRSDIDTFLSSRGIYESGEKKISLSDMVSVIVRTYGETEWYALIYSYLAEAKFFRSNSSSTIVLNAEACSPLSRVWSLEGGLGENSCLLTLGVSPGNDETGYFRRQES